MKKIKKDKDSWGDTIISVYECDKFSYEYQPDMPKLNEKYIKDYIKRKNAKIEGFYDKLYLVENYYKDNWGDRYNKILGGGIKYLTNSSPLTLKNRLCKDIVYL